MRKVCVDLHHRLETNLLTKLEYSLVSSKICWVTWSDILDRVTLTTWSIDSGSEIFAFGRRPRVVSVNEFDEVFTIGAGNSLLFIIQELVVVLEKICHVKDVGRVTLEFTLPWISFVEVIKKDFAIL